MRSSSSRRYSHKHALTHSYCKYPVLNGCVILPKHCRILVHRACTLSSINRQVAFCVLLPSSSLWIAKRKRNIVICKWKHVSLLRTESNAIGNSLESRTADVLNNRPNCVVVSYYGIRLCIWQLWCTRAQNFWNRNQWRINYESPKHVNLKIMNQLIGSIHTDIHMHRQTHTYTHAHTHIYLCKGDSLSNYFQENNHRW